MASTVGKRARYNSKASRMLSESLFDMPLCGDDRTAVGAKQGGAQVKTGNPYKRAAWEMKASSAGKGDCTGI